MDYKLMMLTFDAHIEYMASDSSRNMVTLCNIWQEPKSTVFLRLSAHDRISAQGLFFTVRGGMNSESARVQ